MAAQQHTEAKQTDAILVPAGSGWSAAWKVAAGIAVLGLAGAGAGYASDAKRFAFSYLFAYVVAYTIVMGSFFFVLVQHLTSAGWSVSVRRIAEFFASVSPLLLVLFIPVAASVNTLYPWLTVGHAESGEHAAPVDHADHAAAAHHDDQDDHHGAAMAAERSDDIVAREQAAVEHHEHNEIIQKKHAYLNPSFFFLRAGIYFLVWSLIGLGFFRLSAGQDKTRDPNATRKAQRFAPVATIAFALTLTFAAFDWIMSLEPSWYSTIFGVYIFACSVVSFFALLILMSVLLRRAGLLRSEITVEHFHDLGKLQFGFLVFWAYISFSQFMLIWYASIPEETTFFHRRWIVGWKTISLGLVFIHFIFPFFLILSRNIKRRIGILATGSAIILVMHVIEMYWLVMPYVSPAGVELSWIDAVCFLGVVGAIFAGAFYRLASNSLVAVGDPRLPRALHFENA